MKKSLTSSLVIALCVVAVAATLLAQGQTPSQPQQTGQPPAAGAAQGRGATQQQAAPPRLATREALDDVFQIALGLDSVCMYVLVGRDKALVVDTQTMTEFEGKKIIDYVKDITQKPLLVVNTHPHGDHTAANAQFGEVHLSASGVEEIKAGAARRNTPVTYTLTPVKEGYVFDLGDRQVEVIDIPAHSTGSIALLDRKAGYLFTGDEIDPGQVVGMNPKTIQLHHANMKKLYDKYYRRITQLVPAHNGAPVTKRYIKYFMDLDAKVMAGTATVVPTADGPNYAFPVSPNQVRYRENFAAVIYTKPAQQ
jgi:glyoxylase-like metal-dependent hydrolase (beta-lactamase superfamily II)